MKLRMIYKAAFVVLATTLWLGGVMASMAVAGKVYQIGIVLPGDEWASSIVGFKDGMKKLGYGEGKDVVYTVENAKGDKSKIAAATQKFVAEKVDLIYTITNSALKLVVDATRATKSPVVFGSASGPVESGILPAYASPDAHVTGVTSGSIELVAKRLEILKDVLPRAKRVTALGDADSDSSTVAFALAKAGAAQLGLQLSEVRVKSAQEAAEAAKRMTNRDTDALFLVPSLYVVAAIQEIAQQAKNAKLPFAVYQVEHVKRHGALVSYGSSYLLQGRQAALMVDKIFKGTPVHRIPIERAALAELVLNLDTARDIGFKFSADALSRADELVGHR